MKIEGSNTKQRLNNMMLLLMSISVVAGSGYSIGKEATPNLYLDVPAPILSQWNADNILTVDETVDGFSGATPKTFIYNSTEAAALASTEEGVWEADSVAYITWDLDNGSGLAPGIQVLNDNLDYSMHNCIMASGQMEHPSFPDTVVSKSCNDAQGSSKRYFLQLTQTDTPIDLVFDLGVKDIRYKGLIDSDIEDKGSASSDSTNKDNTIEQFREEYGVGRIYRVIQKIRNDTDKRIASYKFELGTGVGEQFRQLNFIEHGVGFEMRTVVPREFFDGRTGSAPDIEVWKPKSFAKFAPKLFDDGVRPRFDPGFLDHAAAGFMYPDYSADLDWKSQYIDSGLSIDNGIIGSITKNFFNINETHDADLPGNMLGYMLPNNQVPSVIAYWLENDIDAESDGVVAIWDGYNWRSGRTGLDGDPDTIEDNFGIVRDEVLSEWAEKPLGLNIPYEDPDELIRYAMILSDDLAGINTDIFINIDEKLLDEENQPVFDSLTLRLTARSIDDVLPGVSGSEDPDWIQAGREAPDLSNYKIPEDVLEAFNDYTTTDEKTPVIIDILENDVLNGVPVVSSETAIIVVEEPINGDAVINTDFTLTYTPADYFKGNEVFKYEITTGEYVSNVASVRIVVNPEVVLGAPTVQNDNEITTQGVPVQIDVLANDEYGLEESNTVSITINNEPTHGDAIVNEDMNIEFTPEADFSGIVQFTYIVTEDDKQSNTAVVTVRVDELLTEESDLVDDELSISSSGGGCTVGDPNAPVDPTLPLLMFMSVIGLFLRRNRIINES
ncbi:choice-of-anchor F family protein [Vibrio sp. F74]|uniref:choice-of-anchor F family protein n=1 Tax=Vibrio sp. F74 TaxID=700020 RepID=UPI0035F584D8